MLQERVAFGNDVVANTEPYSVDREYKRFPASHVVKLDANEFPEDLPQNIKQAYELAIKSLDLARYPDPESSDLRAKLSAVHGISPDSIVVGSGSDELLANIFQAFSRRTAVLESICYPVYRHLAKLNGIQCHFLSYERETFSSERCFFEEIFQRNPALVCIGYPNNPTGNLISSEIIKNTISQCPETLFVIDEAYYEFSKRTLLSFALSKDNVIVLRTLSKAYGLAGLRVGYAIGGSRVIELLNKIKLPYNLNSVSQCISFHVIEPIYQNMASRIAASNKERDRISRKLKEMGGRVIESHANFLFVNLRALGDSRFIHESLRQRGIFIRAWPTAGEDGWFRISVGSDYHNDALIKSLVEIEACRTS